jgi:hypothetical protein
MVVSPTRVSRAMTKLAARDRPSGGFAYQTGLVRPAPRVGPPA